MLKPDSIYVFIGVIVILLILGYISNQIVSGTISFELALAGFYLQEDIQVMVDLQI
jgi:hypothetical protein